jgi:hypothetical protein
MNVPLSQALIPALAAICGSLVGAFGSATSSWIGQKHEDRRTLLATEIVHREQLYSEFIIESAKALFHATQHTFEDPGRLIPVYGLLNRIRLSSSTNIVECAEAVIDTVLKTYSEPNLTPEAFRARAAERDDPLREFSEICRRDLGSLWKGL